MDRWLDEGTGSHYWLRSFIKWACGRGLAVDIEVPPRRPGDPVSHNSGEVQWQQLRRCLHDATMPLDVRAAATLLLLFGLQVSALVRIHAEHVEQTDAATYLRVSDHALLLPPLLASIIIRQRDRTDLRSVFGRNSATGIRWLFPGLRPGRPMDAASLAQKLNDHGIAVRAARNTALADLAADLPPPVLAQFVGIGMTTAIRWAHHSRRDWHPYLAARLHNRRPDNTDPTVSQ